jgi:hypothetical protein
VTGSASLNALATVTLTAGTGLSGGGDLSANRTFTLANTAVAAGSYVRATITVDAQGRLTSAANGASELPSASGNSGKVLGTTDGTNVSYIGNLSVHSWGNITTSASPTVNKGYNCASSARVAGTYGYSVTFTTAAADGNYSVSVSPVNGTGNFSHTIVSQSTTGFTVYFWNATSAFADPGKFTYQVFGGF